MRKMFVYLQVIYSVYKLRRSLIKQIFHCKTPDMRMKIFLPFTSLFYQYVNQQDFQESLSFEQIQLIKSLRRIEIDSKTKHAFIEDFCQINDSEIKDSVDKQLRNVIYIKERSYSLRNILLLHILLSYYVSRFL